MRKGQFLTKIREYTKNFIARIRRLKRKSRQDHANWFLALDPVQNSGDERLQTLPGTTTLLIIHTISFNNLQDLNSHCAIGRGSIRVERGCNIAIQSIRLVLWRVAVCGNRREIGAVTIGKCRIDSVKWDWDWIWRMALRMYNAILGGWI